VISALPGPETRTDLEKRDDKLSWLLGCRQQYGDCFRVRAESRQADTIVVNHPDWVKRVLVSNHRNYTKGIGIERVRVLLGNGLMTSEGEQWRRQRRMLQPAFHKPRIEFFLGIYLQLAQALADRWQQQAWQRQPVNISASVSDTTLQAILRAVFSDDLDWLVRETGHNPFELISRDSDRDLQFAVKFRALAKPVQQLIDRRVREQRFPPDLLSHCMLARDKSSGEPMSARLLIDEVLTLIVAGHETTAASLSWVWYLLARYPGVMKKVGREARGFAANQMVERAQLQSLVWIPMVIKEALRLYPPGWLYTRRAIAEDRCGDYRIAAGSDVFICSWLLHRHPRYWDEPECFRPERFAPQQEAGRNRYAYIPFSAGPRHCIGETFAMTEMMIHLAVLAARFRITSSVPDDIGIETDVNLRPASDLFLQLETYTA
jgi:cytochrome P450